MATSIVNVQMATLGPRCQSGLARKAQLVSEEIRMLVFLFFGQGDFQIDFCSRLLRSLQVTFVHVLLFSLFQAALNSERHPRLYTAPSYPPGFSEDRWGGSNSARTTGSCRAVALVEYQTLMGCFVVEVSVASPAKGGFLSNSLASFDEGEWDAFN